MAGRRDILAIQATVAEAKPVVFDLEHLFDLVHLLGD
jgi:hypothetical protein